jgi:AraC-like DNA-binding protein
MDRTLWIIFRHPGTFGTVIPFPKSPEALPLRGEGFAGQRIVTLPRPVLQRAATEELIQGLLPTDIGYFPHAAGHVRARATGIDQAIFIYCAHGAGWCEIGGRRHAVKSGELLGIPPGTPHAYGADVEHPWSIYWLHARGGLLPAFLRALEIRAEQPVISIGDGTQAESLFEEVLTVVEHGYTMEHLIQASHTLAHLLVAFIREHRNAPREHPGARPRIATAVALMKQRLHEPLTLDALAASAHLSRSHFVELFKQQVGYAPIDYFIRLRMQRACQLLDTTGMSVKAIAATLGYDDQLYFSRVFRRVNHLTPRDYRRLRKG